MLYKTTSTERGNARGLPIHFPAVLASNRF